MVIQVEGSVLPQDAVVDAHIFLGVEVVVFMVSMLHTIVGADGVNYRSKAPAPEGVGGRVQKQTLVHVVGNFV